MKKKKASMATCSETTTWKRPGKLLVVPCVVDGDHDEHHFVTEDGTDLGKRKVKREDPKAE